MTTWQDLSEEAQASSFVLKEGRRFRAAANRSYYAAFSALAHAFIQQGVAMPKDQEGPSHEAACAGWLVSNNLRDLSSRDRGRLISIMPNLYRLRIIADYRPSSSITDEDVRLALGDMQEAIRILENVT